MNNHIYFKATSVGAFSIRPDRSNRWGLYIESDGDEEFLGSYDSADAAADDIFIQHTGCGEWDIPARINAPTKRTESLFCRERSPK
jgi:hypothetical protein